MHLVNAFRQGLKEAGYYVRHAEIFKEHAGAGLL
jgi:hypothetical protein